MPGPTKVKFKLEDLKAKALESIDERIQMAFRTLDALEDESAFREESKEWRQNAEARIINLAHRLNVEQGITDADLARAAILPNRPQRDEHSIIRARKALESLEAERTKVVAKSESLVPDEQGNISLTKTQLADFFSL